MHHLEEQSTHSKKSDDSGAGAQQDRQDVTKSAQPKMIDKHSVKRRSPPPQRVVVRMDDARSLQADTPTANHGTKDSARTCKRTRIDNDDESSSSTEKGQALVTKQRRKRQSLESKLRHVVEWSHEAHESLRDLEQKQETLEKLCEHQEGETTKLKGGFANLLEATFLFNARLEEDRGRFDDYEEQASKDRTAVKDLASRIQKQEKDIAVQLQRLPTFQEVTDIIAEERKAREDAMKQSTERSKVTVTGGLMIARDRIDKLDKIINANQEQSNTRISEIVDAVDRWTTETATELSVLQTRTSRVASIKDIQDHLILERKAREKALEELRGMWTVGASTLFDTRIASLESKFETTTIPRALESLQDAINALSTSSKQIFKDVQVQMAEAQRKSHMDYDRTVKNMQLKVEAVRTASEKKVSDQAHTISALRDDLSIERAKCEGLEKIVAQADNDRNDDKQQMLQAIEGLKDQFVTKLKSMETAHEVALEANTQNILAKLRGTAENAESRAKESKHLCADVAPILSHLNHLTSRVDTLLRCCNIAKLTSIDVDLLKRQQADHVSDCETKHCDQSEAMKTLFDSMKGQLQKRIDHNFDLQSDLHQTGSPGIMETQSPMRAFRGPEDGGSISYVPKSTVTEDRFASLEARVNKLITAKEMYNLNDLPSRLNSWANSLCSDLDKCKKGVAEDMTTLLALINGLQAQYEKQRGENEDLSAQLKKILGSIPY